MLSVQFNDFSNYIVVQLLPQSTFRTFLSPQKISSTWPYTVSPCSHPQTQATTISLSVPINLPFIDISYKWNCQSFACSFLHFHVFEVYSLAQIDLLVRPLLKAQQQAVPSQSSPNPIHWAQHLPGHRLSPKGSVRLSLNDKLSLMLVKHSEAVFNYS